MRKIAHVGSTDVTEACLVQHPREFSKRIDVALRSRREHRERKRRVGPGDTRSSLATNSMSARRPESVSAARHFRNNAVLVAASK